MSGTLTIALGSYGGVTHNVILASVAWRAALQISLLLKSQQLSYSTPLITVPEMMPCADRWVVTISRAIGMVALLANLMLMAAMNRCRHSGEPTCCSSFR
jgi:hypothetical protein